jgi:DNA-binding transcriptional regulator YiaG
MEFRKETFDVVFHFYKCEDSGEQFTTTALDEVNLNQVYNQYRDKFNIPFPDDIRRIRSRYGLSATKMSDILGLGTNSYRLYESGEIPSIANARLIRMVDDPHVFMGMVRMCTTLDEKTKETLMHKVQHLVEENARSGFESELKEYLLGNHLADIYSGYRNPSLEKFTEMVVFFAERLQPFKTKMNKLLFYADFLMFKQTCFSISGVRYHAIDNGPVPNKYESIFEYLANRNEFEKHVIEFPNGHSGEQFKPRADRPFHAELFTADELNTLIHVASAFKDTSATEIVQRSHLERAWKDNERGKRAIRYDYAFELTQI